MRRSGLIAGVSALAIVLGPGGCGKDDVSDTASVRAKGGTPRVALLMKARTNPFFERMAAGAEAAAKEHGVVLDVMAIDKETEADKQAGHVETAISKGANVILIAPADSKAIVAPLLAAQSRGIGVINLDNRIDAAAAKAAGLKVPPFIGPDNIEGARKSTEALIEEMGGAGKVAMLEGIRGVDNAESRKKGFQEAVMAAGDAVQVVAMETGEWMTEPAQNKMISILNNHPDLKGVFCANDKMAVGVMQAIDSAGKREQVVVTGYDNLEEVKPAILAGRMRATVEQHPDKMGALGVEYAIKLAAGEVVPTEIPVPTDLVTAADLK